MKDYSTPTLKFTLFANDVSITASKPAEGGGETPEETLSQGAIKPSPENPFPQN